MAGAQRNPFSSDWLQGQGGDDRLKPQGGLSYVAGPGDEELKFITVAQLLDRACARHGAGDASVELAFGPHALELTIENAVRPDVPLRASLGGGHGLVGMSERAVLLGGELDAGRRNGAFRVHASLPYGEAA